MAQSSARESGAADWFSHAKALARLMTAGGLSAAIYAIGYAALNQRALTLGLPDTATGPGAYARAGYFFVIDSGGALLAALWRYIITLAVMVAVCGVLAWLAARHIPRSRRLLSHRSLSAIVVCGYVASAATALSAAATIRQAFEARELLVREVTSLDDINASVQCIVKALSEGRTSILQQMYEDTIARVVFAGLILVILWSVAATHATQLLPGVWQLRWLPVAAFLVALSLMPFFYGICYLTAPVCVGLTPTPQYVSELIKLGVPAESAEVVGWLASDLDSNPTVVQVLVVSVPPRLHTVERSKVAAVRFLRSECGSLLPGFAGKTASICQR